MSKRFYMSTEEDLTEEDRKTLFRAWLVCRKVCDMNFAEWLILQGFHILFSVYEEKKQ